MTNTVAQNFGVNESKATTSIEYNCGQKFLVRRVQETKSND